MASPDSIERRKALAEHLARIPASCPADLHGWMENGYVLVMEDDGSAWGDPTPDVHSGAQCAMDAAVHKHGCCWCGKFRSVGRELTDGA